jgi:hypothetical protein
MVGSLLRKRHQMQTARDRKQRTRRDGEKPRGLGWLRNRLLICRCERDRSGAPSGQSNYEIGFPAPQSASDDRQCALKEGMDRISDRDMREYLVRH